MQNRVYNSDEARKRSPFPPRCVQIMDRTWKDGDDTFLSDRVVWMADTPRTAFPRDLPTWQHTWGSGPQPCLLPKTSCLPVPAAVGIIGTESHAAQRRSDVISCPRGCPLARARGRKCRRCAIVPLRSCRRCCRPSLGPTGGRPPPPSMSIGRDLALFTRSAARYLGNASRGVSAMQRMLPERKASTPSLHVRLTDRWRCRVNHVLVDPTLYYFRDDCCARAVVVTDPTTVGKHVRKAVLHVSHPARSEI